MTDFRYVGYIRTPLYSRLLGMARPERLVELEAYRSLTHQLKREKESPVVYEKRMFESYTVSWRREEGKPYTKVVRGLDRMVAERKLGDLIVESMTVEVESPKVVQALNAILLERYEAKGAGDVKRVFLPEKAKLYLSFANNPRERSLRYVRELNAEALDKLSVRSTGYVLDLRSLATERAVKYGEREEWPIDEHADLLRYLLLALDFDGWPEKDRILTLGGVRMTPNPAALRQYVRKKGETWTLTEEVEV